MKRNSLTISAHIKFFPVHKSRPLLVLVSNLKASLKTFLNSLNEQDLQKVKDNNLILIDHPTLITKDAELVRNLFNKATDIAVLALLEIVSNDASIRSKQSLFCTISEETQKEIANAIDNEIVDNLYDFKKMRQDFTTFMLIQKP